MASGRQVQRSAHVFRQQDGPLGADFYFTVKTIIDRLGAKPLVIQLPIGAENAFEGVIDLVEMRALTWRGDVETGREVRNRAESQLTCRPRPMSTVHS